jgi:transcriptional regulator with XRE-family HTH domain
MGFKENLKSELAYSGMLVKELAAKSGVNIHSINNYLNARGQIPSIEAGLKIAQALGVSVEYLVTGKESKLNKEFKETNRELKETSKELKETNKDVRIIAQLAEQLDDEKRQFVIDFIKWIKVRKTGRK